MANIQQVLEGVVKAGAQVKTNVSMSDQEPPATVTAHLHRVVQESLTNALKHAGETSASVEIRYRPDSLELEIADEGAGTSMPIPSGGHGLVGMRERVTLYGGRFDAGPRPSGGFAVRVRLPVR